MGTKYAGIARVEPDGYFGLDYCAARLAEMHQCPAQLLVRPRIIWIQCNRCFEFRPRFWNAILQATKLPSDSVRHLAVGIAVESFAEQPIRPHFVLLRRLTHAVTKVQDEHGR